MKKLLILLLAGVLLININAQKYSSYSHWSVAIHAGVAQFDGDVKQSNPLIPQGDFTPPAVGISVENTLTPLHGFGLEFLYAPYSGTDAVPPGYRIEGTSLQTQLYWGLNFSNWIFKQRNSKWNVYAHLGAGVSAYGVEVTNESGSTRGWTHTPEVESIPLGETKNGWALFIPVGVAIEYNISKAIAVGAKLDYRAFNKDNLDGRYRQNYQGVTNDFLTVGSLRLRYKFDAYNKPHTKNTDLQSFESDLDKKLERKNAAMDSALAKKGRELAEAKQQIKDLEPRLKLMEELLSKDTDGDGVPDYLDLCPHTAASEKVDKNGCPFDKDGDGITDFEDKCPDVAGTIANKGCPEISEKTKKVFERALRGIQFETNKDIIKPISFPILNNVVSIMKENPAYNLTINGHTDSDSSDEYNQVLSEKRANAVMKYLIDYGIDAKRLKAFGFGESRPIADNNTVAGKALNRRVEFIVIF